MHSEQSQSGSGTILERSKRRVADFNIFVSEGFFFAAGLSTLGRGESHNSHWRAFEVFIKVHEGQDHSYKAYRTGLHDEI